MFMSRAWPLHVIHCAEGMAAEAAAFKARRMCVTEGAAAPTAPGDCWSAATGAGTRIPHTHTCTA